MKPQGLNQTLKQYIDTEIVSRYNGFDAAHRIDHAQMVVNQSLEIGQTLNVDINMVYTIAAYHDTGLAVDRATHHLESGKILRADRRLREWFDQSQIEVMAQAVEDHRASSDHAPRSIYGKIVAEADRFIDPDKIITRSIQYGLANFPELDKEGQWKRVLTHLEEKYSERGYLKLWFPDSPNVARLNALRDIIRNERVLREKFETIYARLISGE